MRTIKKMLHTIYNFFFCLKYPFYRIYHRVEGGKPIYSMTWYDYIPGGWKKAFGKQLTKDLKTATKGVKDFKIGDVKEKWGSLRIYPAGSATDEIWDLIHRYEQLSMCYCQKCGDPVRYRTKGWVSYLCETCFMQHMRNSSYSTIGEVCKAYEECRLTEKDIPEPIMINFYKFWDIKKKNNK